MPNPSTEAETRLAQFMGFLERDGGNFNLLADAADAALNAQRADIARQLIDRAEAIAPSSARLRSLRGLAALQQRDYGAAIELFEALDQETPNNPALRFNLAWARAMSHDFEGALSTLDAHTTDALAQAATLHIQSLHQLGKLDEAATAAHQHMARFPSDANLAAAISVLAIDLEDLKLARKTAAIGGDHPDAITTQATLALTDDRPDEARALFERALGVNEAQPRAWVGLGLTAMLAGDNTAAAQDIERGAELFDDHIGSWIAAGWARLLAGDLGAARQHFDRAMRIDHSFGETHGSLAVLCVLEGDLATARREASTAMRLDKQSFSAALATALLAAHAGSKERARAIIDRALTTPIGADGRTLAQVLAVRGLRI